MTSRYLEPVLGWYTDHARDLPWRAPDASAWSVMVSEIMLQQTPVSRVLPAYREWLARWPTPAALAADPPGEAVRQGGPAGYPRPGGRLAAAEWRLAETLLPDEPEVAARWAVGVMELGALVCTAARPRCEVCPVAADCSWLQAGRPAAGGRPGGPNGSGPGPWTAWSPTAWSTPSPTANLRYQDLRRGDLTGPANRAFRPGERPVIRAVPQRGAEGIGGSRRSPPGLTQQRRPDREVWAPLRTYCLALGWLLSGRDPFAAASRLDLGRRGVGHRLGLGHTGEGELGRRPLTISVDDHDLTRTELPEQDLLRQRVLDLALDRTEHRAGPRDRVVTALRQQRLGARGKLQTHVTVLQPLIDLAHHQVHDRED